MKTFGIDECAAFLNIARTHALTLAGTGELPGAKIGREWVFLESDLIDYLQVEVKKQVRERRSRAVVSEELEATAAMMPSMVRQPRGRARTLPRLSDD
ncbi:MAG: hypothetical protein NVS3B3_23110 [Aquirhabdus sp.]